ncbi:MAG TPA: DUF1801 domain-containing protein [Gammaproteobacteria bacterium]|nr:DUF1801 domain-containing protein [Gammaproteobacteria bacterium]
MLRLRQLVLDTGAKYSEVGGIEETLRWGEPSYITKKGSTLRIGWKDSTPDQYAMFFHCQTQLVDTFKELYRDTFEFEGNRAIVFDKKDKIPVRELTHCIFLTLTNHQRKHLPLLGA